MKVTIDGWLHWDNSKYHVKQRWDWSPAKLTNCSWFTPVKPLSIEIEVPDDFDPRPAQVEAKRAEIRKVEAEFSKRVMELKAELNNLLALEAS